jgi:hypothetical protein
MMHTRYFMVFISLFAANVIAADLNPPAWRGQPGATFQAWDFHYEENARMDIPSTDCLKPGFIEDARGNPAIPSIVENPYVQSTGICVEFRSLWFINDSLDWLPQYFGREGVWQLLQNRRLDNFMNFFIPNSNTPGDLETIVRIQLIYHGIGLSPILSVKYPTDVEVSDNDIEPVLVSSETFLPRSWKHMAMSFRLEGCPRYASIFIYPPERADVFIDSVAIDTICTDNADSLLGQ